MPKKPSIEEIAAGPEESFGHPHSSFGPRPPIAEMPWFEVERPSPEAVAELFRLRDRVHTLESQALAGRLRVTHPPRYEIPTHLEALYRGNLPNELPPPDDGEGGGSGGVRFQRWWINELPPPPEVLRDLSALLQRLSVIEASIASLNAKVEAVGAKGNAGR